jgi:predicted O-methyltransferase YrrM
MARSVRVHPRQWPIEHAYLALERHRFAGGLLAVDDFVGLPEFERLRARICEAGTDCIRHYGSSYLLEGGLALQQNPDEFAALCTFLGEWGPYSTYLEIGSGSGGTGRFLGEELSFDLAMSIDDGEARQAPEQAVNLAGFRRFVGDSHSPEAATFISETLAGLPVDLAFIDGDHSAAGAWDDVELVLPFCAPGSIVVMHDTRARDAVGSAWLRAARQGLFVPVAEFVGEDHPFGIGVGRISGQLGPWVSSPTTTAPLRAGSGGTAAGTMPTASTAPGTPGRQGPESPCASRRRRGAGHTGGHSIDVATTRASTSGVHHGAHPLSIRSCS